MIECRECRERLTDLLEDDFASNEASVRVDLRAHLETCADCSRELQFLSAIRDDLRSFNEAPAPQDLRSQVRARLLNEKTAPTKAKKPLFALPSMRLALSGGALLAACCLLLVVRSSNLNDSLLSLPTSQESAPTQENFEVPDAAFKETPKEKATRLSTAKATKKLQSAPVIVQSPPQDESSQHNRKSASTSPVAGSIQKPADGAISRADSPTRMAQADKRPPVALPAPKAAAPPKVHNRGKVTEKLANASGNQPMPTINPRNKSTDNTSDNNRGAAKANLNVVEPPKVATSMGTLQRSGTQTLLDSGSPSIPGGARGPAGAFMAKNNATENAVPPLPNASVALQADNMAADNTFSAAAPRAAMGSSMRKPNGIGTASIKAVRHADYTIALNTAQTFTLSVVPQQDSQLAQIRLTLPEGLQFADATNPNAKPETSRIIWRGAAQKDIVIENAVELRAITQGFKRAALTLENADGQNLQTKITAFQVQEAQITNQPPFPPGADLK